MLFAIGNFQGCRPVYRKSKTSKQFQSVAKQFGSIGKKLRKNLGQFSKGALARKGSFRGGQRSAHSDRGYFQGRRMLGIGIGQVYFSTNTFIEYQEFRYTLPLLQFLLEYFQ